MVLEKDVVDIHHFFLTGCDSTSAFYGKGKERPWKILQKHHEFRQTFSQLGSLERVSQDLINSLNKFVCLLYYDEVSTHVDECRYNLFKSGKCSDETLPPNFDSLQKHIERANFQAYICNWCLSANLDLPLSENNGWLVSNGQLQISWMTKPAAPDSLLEFVQCKCKTGCETMRCSCLKSGLKCTDFCQCVSCHNGKEDDSDEDDDELSDSCCHINEEEDDD